MDNDVKIYFDERIVVLTDKNIKSSAINNDQIHIFENKKKLKNRLKRFGESNDEYLYIYHPDINELFKYTKGCFKFIEAAGGLVTLPDKRMLLIHRLGKWDLPKGKAEKGESLQETAVREVVEECGLEISPIITGELTHTFHTYHQNGNHILKHTAWYTMRYNGNVALHPQYSEDITEAVWLSPEQLNAILQNTYESIKQVLDSWLKAGGG